MRPPRLILLLFCFIALPIFLTFLSLVSAHPSPAGTLNTEFGTQSNRLRAFFSFNTPSTLFPPSALISLTNDNSTFFLARPANFGEPLPNDGLSGRLWVGKGFAGGAASGTEGELGCSDVPGWDEGDQKHSDEQRAKTRLQSKKIDNAKVVPVVMEPEASGKESPETRSSPTAEKKMTKHAMNSVSSQEDGTDDHLHHPLSESNPAKAAEPGQSAEHESINDKKKATHADIQSLQESAEIAGKVVLLSRGGCGFLEKVKWTQRRGGIALIVGDDQPGEPLITMYARGDTSNVTIPALFTSYTTAHLLSSLVPLELSEDTAQDSTKDQLETKAGSKKLKDRIKANGPTFTSSKAVPTSTEPTRAVVFSTTDSRASRLNKQAKSRKWLSGILSALGVGEENGYPWHIGEDSRRPPSSGNIDWVLLEDWDEEEPTFTSTRSSAPGTATSTVAKALYAKPKSSSAHQSTSGEFVIGVQDWRDPDLVMANTKGTSNPSPKDKPAKAAESSSIDSPAATGAFKGGSITPGSGEYGNTHLDHKIGSGSKDGNNVGAQDTGSKAARPAADDKKWFGATKWGLAGKTEPYKSMEAADEEAVPPSNDEQVDGSDTTEDEDEEERDGLWVTLTPTTVSTSPFFDTLLVLVVSPLVTLTVVYALLLLRSRIRRRRWRAPKSVVERLPVRTYHTISSSSSTTSSQVASPNASSPTSPLLRSTSQAVTSRSRPRSHTTSDVIPGAPSSVEFSPQSSSPAKEKPVTGPQTRKRYTGRQIECVVCLEEYVDGQSRVMSLPCGHEFHEECM